MFLDKIAQVARLTPTAGDTDQEDYQAVSGLEAIRINVQPASAEVTALAEGVFGQTFTGFVRAVGIKLGDRITISGSNLKLITKGIQDHNWGPIPHLELILFKGDN